MKILNRLIVLVLLGVAIVAGLSFWNTPAPVRGVDTLIVQSQVVADGTVKIVTKTRLIRDTLLQYLTDTVRVKEYIYQTDTLRIACERCAAQLRLVTAAYQARGDTIAQRDSALQRERSRRKWWTLGGATLGAVLRR